MQKIILSVEGMACGMCEAHMNDAIRRDFKVKKVTSSHKEKRTEIESELPLDRAALQKTVEDTGYTLLDVSVEEVEKKGFFSALKKS